MVQTEQKVSSGWVKMKAEGEKPRVEKDQCPIWPRARLLDGHNR